MRPRSRRRDLIGAAGVGLLAGFLSGLFGVGGGILIVPGLVLLMRMNQRLAHGTSLAAIVPIAVAGVAGYALADAVDWTAGALLIVGAAAGTVVGTTALRVVPENWLRALFAAFLVLAAARLFLPVTQAMGRGAIDPGAVMGLVGIGVLSGAVAGLLGVGGGIVIVPALVLLFSLPDPVAKGTSLLVIIPTGLIGTLSNVRARNANLPVAAVVGALGIVSAFGASQLSTVLPARLSRILFAILLLAVAAQLLLRLRRGAAK
ncbi:MAG TPA: sulfite exporter TauE/SafE family protein [Actinomycetota bacterium]|nr:sulfite exporter TauE/SafE family protein [Actinomycetota bacterium]